MAEIVKLNEIYGLKLIGYGRNKRDMTSMIFFSRSGTEILENYLGNMKKKEQDPNDTNLLNDLLLSNLDLYMNSKQQPILTKKDPTDSSRVFIGYIGSDFRGTSGIQEISENGLVISVTGSGDIGQDTEFICKLPRDGYIIGYWDGRNSKGFRCWKWKFSALRKMDFLNDGKFCEYPNLDMAKISFGLAELE